MLLSNIHGRKVLTGIDAEGKNWEQFELDYHFDERRGKCFLCGKQIEFGWVNMSSPGKQVCDDEIIYSGMRSYFFPDEIVDDRIENNWWN